MAPSTTPPLWAYVIFDGVCPRLSGGKFRRKIPAETFPHNRRHPECFPGVRHVGHGPLYHSSTVGLCHFRWGVPQTFRRKIPAENSGGNLSTQPPPPGMLPGGQTCRPWPPLPLLHCGLMSFSMGCAPDFPAENSGGKFRRKPFHTTAATRNASRGSDM